MHLENYWKQLNVSIDVVNFPPPSKIENFPKVDDEQVDFENGFLETAFLKYSAYSQWSQWVHILKHNAFSWSSKKRRIGSFAGSLRIALSASNVDYRISHLLQVPIHV